MNPETIVNGTIGVGGTTLAAILAKYSADAATLAGLLTAAWMARQLWLSFRRPVRLEQTGKNRSSEDAPGQTQFRFRK